MLEFVDEAAGLGVRQPLGAVGVGARRDQGVEVHAVAAAEGPQGADLRPRGRAAWAAGVVLGGAGVVRPGPVGRGPVAGQLLLDRPRARPGTRRGRGGGSRRGRRRNRATSSSTPQVAPSDP